MHKLIWGIVEFRERLLPEYAARFRDLVLAQTPDALFITCSDSRVVPNLLASTEPGELFVMRNVGNLIPPAKANGRSSGDVSEASAIEYALLALNVRHIVVCGHSECGAMKAALDPKGSPQAPNLAQWLDHARPAAVRLSHDGPLDPSLAPHDQLSQLNVLTQIEHLLSYPIVEERVTAGELTLSGWWFDIKTGEMHAYEADRQRFQIIDRAEAERLIARLDGCA